MISALTECAWERWINVTRSRCHLHFEIEGGVLTHHVQCGMEAGRRTAARIKNDLVKEPSNILEVGSSVGFNCLALAERFPRAKIVGVEPDGEACVVARAMAADFRHQNVVFVRSVGESLPFFDSSFDWIVCHTVIEHVTDVNVCIAEMARVLRSGGFLHLDAPNYLWPWEPHLRIVVPPLCPKPLMRLLACLQGQSRHIKYTEHLKLVHPRWIERCFSKHGLSWKNRAENKLLQASSGDLNHIVAYRRLASLLALPWVRCFSNLLISSLLHMRLYPSLLYTARKNK